MRRKLKIFLMAVMSAAVCLSLIACDISFLNFADISEEDLINTLLQNIDVNELLKDADMNELLKDVDMNRLLKNVDKKELLKGATLRDILDPLTCYTNLLTELNVMLESCVSDPTLGSSQAYTILMTYGIADMSLDVASMPAYQLATKAQLYNEIQTMNFYAGGFGQSVIVPYDESKVRTHTNNAVSYCSQMIGYFY